MTHHSHRGYPFPTPTLQPYPSFLTLSTPVAQGELEGVGWEGGRVGPKHPSTDLVRRWAGNPSSPSVIGGWAGL